MILLQVKLLLMPRQNMVKPSKAHDLHDNAFCKLNRTYKASTQKQLWHHALLSFFAQQAMDINYTVITDHPDH